jgi:hypothetical protein
MYGSAIYFVVLKAIFTLPLNLDDGLSYYKTDGGEFGFDAVNFVLLIGGSSRDINWIGNDLL